MSYGYSQVLRSGLIVMAADRCYGQQGFIKGTGQLVYEQYDTIQKIHITKNKIGITAGGKCYKKTLEYVNEYISNLECKTPLETARCLKSYTLSIDPKAELVFAVGGFTDKPELYEVFTTYRGARSKDGIMLVNNGERIANIATGCAYENFNTEIIVPNIDKIKNFNKRDVIEFIQWSAAQARERHDKPERISKEINILLIFDDHYEWIGGFK